MAGGCNFKEIASRDIQTSILNNLYEQQAQIDSQNNLIRKTNFVGFESGMRIIIKC